MVQELAAAARTLGYTAADLPGSPVDPAEWARWLQVADLAGRDQVPCWSARCGARDLL